MKTSARRSRVHAGDPIEAAVLEVRQQALAALRRFDGKTALCYLRSVWASQDRQRLHAQRALLKPPVQTSTTLTGDAAASVAVDVGPPDDCDGEGDGADDDDSPSTAHATPLPAFGHRHIYLPRRPSFESSGRLLVLALVLDRDGGHPDNITAIAQALGVQRKAARGWRDSLIADGVLQHVAGFLVINPIGFDRWRAAAETDLARRHLRFGFDPVPRRLLRSGQSPAVLHAAALVYSDATGFREAGRFVRADHERADLANVSLPTVRQARSVLATMGFVEVEELRRGRASLRRAKLAADRKGARGSAMSETRAAVLAARAERGRGRRAAGGSCVASERGSRLASHHQVPTEPFPIRAATGPAKDGPAERREQDGGVARCQTVPTRYRKPAGTDPKAAEVRRHVEDFLADKATIDRFAKLAERRPEQATRELLHLAGCFDASRRRTEGWPKMLVQRWRTDAPILLLGVIADVVGAGGRNRATNIGAVLASRLPRLLAGRPTDALSKANRDKSISQIVARFQPKASDEGSTPAPGVRPAAQSTATSNSVERSRTRMTPVDAPNTIGREIDAVLRGITRIEPTERATG